ncbi:hypothetical protein [Maricaulis sp.]|uniref:lysozyme n=1 Tax=Maricaulis sp. TaxID=1486257 RepID=UPI00260E8902|nr:hypothetical protein [Maricaulis sp.]
MKPRLKSSPAARELIQRFEPFRDTAERGPDGRWVVGYGHRAAARRGIKVSEEEASLLLIYDVMRAEQAIDEMTSVQLARGQRDALISFVHDIGLDAFRGSDVARYLFEGRMDAAGEALASHGDGSNPRREAESAMFLAAQAPAKVRSQPVELVIKVEHPSEERVLEGAIAGGRDAGPVQDYAPPPPPMPDRAITSRREAEAEIARILATVEAMPLEEREHLAAEDVMAPMETVVSDLSDEPIEGKFRSAEAMPEAEAAAEPVDEEAGEPVQAEASRADADESAGKSAEAQVMARMAQEIEAEEPAEPDTAAAEPEAPAPLADFSLPAGTELGFALTRIPEAEQVAGEAGPGRAGAAPVAEAEAREKYALDLPEGVGLGYAFTSVLAGRFRAGADPAQSVPVSDVLGEPDAAGEAETSAISADVQDSGVQDADAQAGDMREGDAQEDAVADIVERAVAVAGDGTPPPHPAETPAESAGAVGEVEGGPVQAESATRPDVVEGDPLMPGEDPLTGDEEFSPRDLATDMHAEQKKPAAKPDDGIWGFLSIFIAGCVVAGYGFAVTYGDWGRMLAERTLTMDAWATIGGVFLMVASAWPMISAIVERLKRNRPDQAKGW